MYRVHVYTALNIFYYKFFHVFYGSSLFPRSYYISVLIKFACNNKQLLDEVFAIRNNQGRGKLFPC